MFICHLCLEILYFRQSQIGEICHLNIEQTSCRHRSEQPMQMTGLQMRKLGFWGYQSPCYWCKLGEEEEEDQGGQDVTDLELTVLCLVVTSQQAAS